MLPTGTARMAAGHNAAAGAAPILTDKAEQSSGGQAGSSWLSGG